MSIREGERKKRRRETEREREEKKEKEKADIKWMLKSVGFNRKNFTLTVKYTS